MGNNGTYTYEMNFIVDWIVGKFRKMSIYSKLGELSIMDLSMLEIFWRQKLQYIWLENLTCTDKKIF